MILDFSWADPTTNADGSPIVAGEITGYTIGIRNVLDAGHGPGNYALTISAPSAAQVSAVGSAAMDAVSPGTYLAAIQTNGPVNSAWGPLNAQGQLTEVTFVVPVPAPTPSPPSGFSVAVH